jgi:hypothetical protein
MVFPPFVVEQAWMQALFQGQPGRSRIRWMGPLFQNYLLPFSGAAPTVGQSGWYLNGW